MKRSRPKFTSSNPPVQGRSGEEYTISQSNPCTDLINEAICILQAALDTCCPCTTTYHGTIVSCLQDTTIQFLDTPLMGNATVNAVVSSACQHPLQSSVIFNFLVPTDALKFNFYSTTISQLQSDSSSIVMFGTGTFVLGNIVLEPYYFSFKFNNLPQCSFELKVSTSEETQDEFLSATGIVHCANMDILPCTRGE